MANHYSGVGARWSSQEEDWLRYVLETLFREIGKARDDAKLKHSDLGSSQEFLKCLGQDILESAHAFLHSSYAMISSQYDGLPDGSDEKKLAYERRMRAYNSLSYIDRLKEMQDSELQELGDSLLKQRSKVAQITVAILREKQPTY